LVEAQAELERALALDPNSWEVNHDAGIMFFFQRRFKEAARYFEKAASLDEMDFHSWTMLSSVYEALGDGEGVARAARMAVTRAERAIAQNPANGAALVTGATGLALLGEVDRFLEWKDRALLLDPSNMIMLYNFACIMARLKDFDGALDLLERRLKTVTPAFLRGMFTDPDLDELRELPRFKAMINEAQERLRLNDPVAMSVIPERPLAH
jgi:adenylate cyclase